MNSTHHDWNPANVDLMSVCGIARHFGYPVELVWKMAAYDPAFPPYRRDSPDAVNGDCRI